MLKLTVKQVKWLHFVVIVAILIFSAECALNFLTDADDIAVSTLHKARLWGYGWLFCESLAIGLLIRVIKVSDAPSLALRWLGRGLAAITIALFLTFCFVWLVGMVDSLRRI